MYYFYNLLKLLYLVSKNGEIKDNVDIDIVSAVEICKKNRVDNVLYYALLQISDNLYGDYKDKLKQICIAAGIKSVYQKETFNQLTKELESNNIDFVSIKGIEIKKIYHKEDMRVMGDIDIVVVQDEDIVKVHVHTLKPGNALNIAQRYGEFVKLKIENMQEQHNTILEGGNAPTAATPVKQEAKEVAVISVAAGDGVRDMFMELHCDHVVSGGQTMNPATEDIVEAIRNVNAKHVIILPNNSNIVMTAQQAALVLEDEIDVIVIPSKTIPQGLSACIMFNPELSLEENVEEMKDAIANVKTGQVTYAIKDTNIDGVEIKANNYMALCEKEITACVPDKLDALKTTLEQLVDEDAEIITLIYGEDVTEEEAEEIEAFVEDNYEAELELVNGKQPVYSFIVGVE